MNFMSTEDFTKAWADLDVTSDPRAIHEAFERDQEAEDEAELKREGAS